MWVDPGREEEYRLAGHKPVEKDAAGARTAPALPEKTPRQARKKRAPVKK